MRRTLQRALLLVFCIAAACGGVAAPGQSLAPPSPSTAALEGWKDFPVHTNPRPVIWFETRGLETPGFPNGDAKLAAICNKLVLAPGLTLPAAGPVAATVTWPSSSATYHGSISAVQAWAVILYAAVAQDKATCARLEPLVVEDVRLGSHKFLTDRGWAQMTSWLFDLPSVNGVYPYPVLDPSTYWGGGPVSANAYGAIGGHLSGDGRTLTISVVGGPDTPGPCGVDYSASAAESSTAVAVAIASRVHGGPDTICTLVGYPRTVTVTLKTPLGARVLVDASGNVGTVCLESESC